MEKTELDQDIKDTIQAIKDLKESGDEGALILAVNDLTYLQSWK